VFLPAAVTTLPRDSVVNVTDVVTHSKDELCQPIASVPNGLMVEVDQGLRNGIGAMTSDAFRAPAAEPARQGQALASQ
jgi:mRNA-degrading endonuclease toxin of MazEF toxin-antitoxin module